MELEAIKTRWQEQTAPAYSTEELTSIGEIRNNRVAGSFKKGLSIDLLIAEIAVIGFILLLQLFDLRYSNFWSVIMAFLGAQHLVFYLAQVWFIERYLQPSGNLIESIERASRRLTVLLWHYRIWPTALSLTLFLLYQWQYSSVFTTIELVGICVLLAAVTVFISNKLSAALVKRHIDQLTDVKLFFEQHS